MRESDKIRGQARAELCAGDPAALLNGCLRCGLRLWDVEAADACTLRLSFSEEELPTLEELAQRQGAALTILERRGGRELLRRARRRAVLLLAALGAAFLLALSSLFIWDFEITGCETLTRARVLRALAECGVEEGRFWPGLETDLLRSRLLLELPELSWITVNVRGSRALVQVQERQEKPELAADGAPADLVAARDGLILETRVLAGQEAARPGEIVQRGQLLVSGSLESLSGARRLVRARGSVLAETWTEQTAVCPMDAAFKGSPGRARLRFALKIGKNRVNLYFGSGKTLDGYDRIVHEYKLGLRGLFALPLSLVCEEQIPRPAQPGSLDAAQLEQALGEALRAQLKGELVSEQLESVSGGGLAAVRLRAVCREEIAVIQEIEREGFP